MACLRRYTLLLARPVCWAIRRTPCVPLSQKLLKIRRLLSQNPMSVLCSRGLLNSRQNSAPQRTGPMLNCPALNGYPQRGIDRCQRGFFFPERTQHGVGTDTQRPCGIANPTGVEAHINDLLLDLRQPPLIAVLKQKTLWGTRSILAQITLCAAACLATFNDLIAMTIGTA